MTYIDESDDAIIGKFREQIRNPIRPADKTIIPDNLPHGGREYVRPVALEDLPPMARDYRLQPRVSRQRCAWWALPFGVRDFLRQHRDKLHEALAVTWGLIVFLVLLSAASMILG